MTAQTLWIVCSLDICLGTNERKMPVESAYQFPGRVMMYQVIGQKKTTENYWQSGISPQTLQWTSEGEPARVDPHWKTGSTPVQNSKFWECSTWTCSRPRTALGILPMKVYYQCSSCHIKQKSSLMSSPLKQKPMIGRTEFDDMRAKMNSVTSSLTYCFYSKEKRNVVYKK